MVSDPEENGAVEAAYAGLAACAEEQEVKCLLQDFLHFVALACYLNAYQTACVYLNCLSWSWNSCTLRICRVCIHRCMFRLVQAEDVADRLYNKYNSFQLLGAFPSYGFQAFLDICNASCI